MAAQGGRVLVYGGKGALGCACVKYFKQNNYVSVYALYLLHCHKSNTECHVLSTSTSVKSLLHCPFTDKKKKNDNYRFQVKILLYYCLFEMLFNCS